MPLTQRLQQGFLRLPFARKVLLVSSATLMISPLMPWYDFRNRFGVGESLNGLQGPLFLVGALVMAMGAVGFFNMFFPLLGRNFFQLKKRSGLIAAGLGAQSLLLLVVANTVFLHPDYSTEATRATQFGMMVALASVASMTAFGIWVHRYEQKGESSWGEELIVATPTPVAAVSNEAPEMYSAPTPMPVVETPVESHFNSAVDPLTLDARTRYRLMQGQMRRSSNERQNMWGNAPRHSEDSTHSSY